MMENLFDAKDMLRSNNIEQEVETNPNLTTGSTESVENDAAATGAMGGPINEKQDEGSLSTKEMTPPMEGKEIRDETSNYSKHPLQNVWTMWYLENDRTKAWTDMQNEITSFDTVEDFWSLYNYIKPPSEIKLGCDYSLFKRGIRPMWEDNANCDGGRWVITFNRIFKEDLDKLWLDVLLCLIGEVLNDFGEICGAVINVRAKNFKISIWIANGSNKIPILNVGRKLRDTLRLGPHNMLQYQLHKDTMSKQDSNTKAIYYL